MKSVYMLVDTFKSVSTGTKVSKGLPFAKIMKIIKHSNIMYVVLRQYIENSNIHYALSRKVSSSLLAISRRWPLLGSHWCDLIISFAIPADWKL